MQHFRFPEINPLLTEWKYENLGFMKYENLDFSKVLY